MVTQRPNVPGMILREARPPRRSRPSWPYYVSALAFGTGAGAIAFYGWLLVGTGLIVGAGWLLHLHRYGDHSP